MQLIKLHNLNKNKLNPVRKQKEIKIWAEILEMKTRKIQRISKTQR
jgi:hypothetical protein